MSDSTKKKLIIFIALLPVIAPILFALTGFATDSECLGRYARLDYQLALLLLLTPVCLVVAVAILIALPKSQFQHKSKYILLAAVVLYVLLLSYAFASNSSQSGLKLLVLLTDGICGKFDLSGGF